MMTNARTAFMNAAAARIFAVLPRCDCKEERRAKERVEVQVCWDANCLSFAVLWCRLARGGKVDPLAPRVGGWRTVCYDAAPWHIPELPLRRMLLTLLPPRNGNQGLSSSLPPVGFPALPW